MTLKSRLSEKSTLGQKSTISSHDSGPSRLFFHRKSRLRKSSHNPKSRVPKKSTFVTSFMLFTYVFIKSSWAMERALERTPGSCGIGCNFITMELSVHFCPVSKCTIHPICCEDFGITMLEGNDEYLCISCHVRSLSRSYVNGVLEEAYNDDDYNDNNFAEKIDQASIITSAPPRRVGFYLINTTLPKVGYWCMY